MSIFLIDNLKTLPTNFIILSLLGLLLVIDFSPGCGSVLLIFDQSSYCFYQKFHFTHFTFLNAGFYCYALMSVGLFFWQEVHVIADHFVPFLSFLTFVASRVTFII